MESTHKESEFINFLLVEDDDDHATLVKRTLGTHRITNKVIHVNDGAEALKYLKRQDNYKDSAEPNVIILDLNLPKMSGHQVLKEIKTDPKFRHIPVVVLTTSDIDIDREQAYREHANSYLVKPLDFKTFEHMVNELILYWGIVNAAPKKRKGKP
ncbi:MAG: response regulator [Bdellovibrionota bacterium]